MALVTVRLNGYPHTVGCEDDQEEHLLAMAAEVEARLEQVKALGSPSGEARLLALAALMMADELHDLNAAMAAMRAQLAKAEAAKSRAKTKSAEVPDAALTRRLTLLAQRAEEIAAGLEHA